MRLISLVLLGATVATAAAKTPSNANTKTKSYPIQPDRLSESVDGRTEG